MARLAPPVVLALLALAVPAALSVPAPAPSAAPERPSVLLVTLDTTRADRLGCYGAKDARTPNLDALATAGTRFDRALSPVPLTLPAHATLMSGRVPRRHGVRDNGLAVLASDVPVLAERLAASGWATAGFVSSVVLDRRTGISRGFARYDDGVRIGDRRAFNYEERAASQTTDAALAWAAQARGPFFLWVHYFDPHLPYVPPEPYASSFPGRPYDGEIAFMDAQVGRLLAEVRKKAPRLVVIAAGDHGEGLGDHGEAAHGVFLYQSTQRVPLILAGPGIPAGRAVARSVGLVDLAPTLLDLLGLPALPATDGRSLLPLMRGTAEPAPDYEMESRFGESAYGWAPLRALVRGGLKAIEAPRPELYDLDADPAEAKDLAAARPGDLRALAAALGERVEAREAVDSPEDAAERRERLASLGYVSGGSAEPGAAPIDPKDGIAWMADLDAARRALQLGDPREAIAPLERLLARNPGNQSARLTLAQAWLLSGDPRRAVATAREAVSRQPADEAARFNLANALSELGRTDRAAADEAVEAYRAVLKANPRHADATLSLAALLVRQRKPADARKALEAAREAGVRDPDLETELGVLALAEGRPEDAVASLDRALALNPRAVIALELRGKLAYGRGQAREAEGFYARALEAAPSAGLARTLGAIRLYDLGDREGARQAWSRALELTPPGSPEATELVDLLRELAP